MERASESNRALASSESKHDGVEAEGEGKWGGEKEEEEEEQWKGVEEQGSTAQGSTSLPFLTSKPLHLAYGLLKYTWLLPELISSRAASIRDTFIEPLPPAVAELSYDERPSSVVELAIRFLHFLALDIKPTNDRFGDLKHTLAVAFNQFEAEFLQYDELHTLVANQVKGHAKRLAVIGAYYEVRHVLGRPVHLYEPNMLRAARLNDAKIFAIFGGQGNTEDYFSELREVYLTYRHFVHDFLHYGSQILLELSASLETEGLFPKGFDIMRWLQYPAEQPLADYLIPAPVSFPLIGLLQLTQYALTCKLLGIDPGTFRERLSGLSGHSQGIIAAMVVSVAGTWESFNATAKTALVVLFWVGVRSQEAFPRTTIPPSLLEESLSHDEGSPTPMLSVRNLSRETLQQQIDLTNKHLSEQRQMHIGLFNGPRSFVVSGPPTSLCGLNAHLRDIKAPSGIDQTRVPFSERKAVFTHVFLPVSVPFHSPYLRKACAQVLEDLGELYISSFSLRVPLFATDDGSVLGSEKSAREELLPRLVRMIMCEPVKWQEATEFLNATHILDFGPGGRSGAGLIVYQNKEGSGVRVISACSVSQNSKEIAHIHELLDRNRNRPINYNTSWQRQYGPRLVKTAAGRVYVDTKFSRLLGLDHLMVAGMTPCTVPEDFVAATMNAGYHIELAGGGYYDPQKLANAVRRIARSVVPGRTITVNIVYVNPHAVSWQIPVIKQLRLEGLPVDGLTIGAGIPTLEVAAQYITSLGLRHIAFKPSSVETIQQVIQIAKIDEAFPIILQWTGGRGGGHHSYEDFHQPVVQMYAKIRECPNIILVAGSGFGGAEDTYPYITGKWAVDLKLSRSPMPFDGILLGSRMMIAKEAHTSTAAKQLIVNTEGSDDVQWEKTYRGSHGGILTVRSEMGEPIHKIATRGVKLWAELDSTIFSLDRSKRVAELQRRREEIIKRLEDYQKVWFGKSSSGKPVDVDEMTYAEVLNRMADLLYVKHQSRWIHISYQGLLSDFIRRTEERFMSKKAPSMIQNRTELKDPLCTIRKVVSVYPKCQQHLVTAQDAEYFLLLCQKRGQKPSEDLEAVIDQDVGRICILQGPVAVRHSRTVDEPVKDILEAICQAHIQKIVDDSYSNPNDIPVEEYFTTKPALHQEYPDLNYFKVCSTDRRLLYRFSYQSSIALPNANSWLQMLAGTSHSWRHALFSTDVLVQNDKIVDNPFKRIFEPVWETDVEISFPSEPRKSVISIRQRRGAEGDSVDLVQLRATSDREIVLTLYEHRNVLNEKVGLSLEFTYHPETGFAPIRERMESRNHRIKEFYHRLWFGNEKSPVGARLTDPFNSSVIKVDCNTVKDFLRAVGNSNEAYLIPTGERTGYAPMDFAIKASFKAMTEPLLLDAVDGDILQTVHLKNSFRMLPNVEPIMLGDVLGATSHIDAVLIQDSGKVVQTSGVITRDGVPLMEVTSQSMYKGKWSDFENTFHRKVESPMTLRLSTAKDVKLLQSMEWFHVTDLNTDFLGKTLTFRLESFIHFQDKSLFKSIRTAGRVLLEVSESRNDDIAYVKYEAGLSYGNPVIDYLEHHGSLLEQRHMFDQPVPLTRSGSLSLEVPDSNDLYARVSGDFNPIHVSRIFSRYAGYAGTVTHGMYISAVVRGLVETLVAENDIQLMKSFSCSFVGMVWPQDRLDVKLWHVGMVSGRKLIKVEATRNQDEKVLLGEAEVEQPTTAYIFTGQGSQYPGMGMELYARSSIAREIWDCADSHLLHRFGFSILQVVKENPKQLTIHFGGTRGRDIRKNYMFMLFESTAPEDRILSRPIFKDIDEDTESYTYRSPQGLLYLTEFAQPALMVAARASFDTLRAKGLIQGQSFAGHSLGEYAALSSLANIMSIDQLVSVAFYRGLSMQANVDRDSLGHTNYAMCAVNPSRISKNFDEQALRYLVEAIHKETKWLLEIVNFNIQDLQYTCTGDLRALDTLISVTNSLKAEPFAFSSSGINAETLQMIHTCAAQARAKATPLVLSRGVCATPLHGIDMPFHSTFLRSGIGAFRSQLLDSIKKDRIEAQKLVGKWIPNLTGKPFTLTREYFEEVGRLTGSKEVGRLTGSKEVARILKEANPRPTAAFQE